MRPLALVEPVPQIARGERARRRAAAPERGEDRGRAGAPRRRRRRARGRAPRARRGRARRAPPRSRSPSGAASSARPGCGRPARARDPPPPRRAGRLAAAAERAAPFLASGGACRTGRGEPHGSGASAGEAGVRSVASASESPSGGTEIEVPRLEGARVAEPAREALCGEAGLERRAGSVERGRRLALLERDGPGRCRSTRTLVRSCPAGAAFTVGPARQGGGAAATPASPRRSDRSVTARRAEPVRAGVPDEAVFASLPRGASAGGRRRGGLRRTRSTRRNGSAGEGIAGEGRPATAARRGSPPPRRPARAPPRRTGVVAGRTPCAVRRDPRRGGEAKGSVAPEGSGGGDGARARLELDVQRGAESRWTTNTVWHFEQRTFAPRSGSSRPRTRNFAWHLWQMTIMRPAGTEDYTAMTLDTKRTRQNNPGKSRTYSPRTDLDERRSQRR